MNNGGTVFIEFTFKGLALSAIAHVKTPVYGCTGHPSDWDEGEPGEILIESLECNGKDANFLLAADFGGELEDAAYLAATSGKRQAA
jgi:hypothetical protein